MEKAHGWVWHRSKREQKASAPNSLDSDDSGYDTVDSLVSIENAFGLDQPNDNSEEAVQLEKGVQIFKKMSGKAWKSSATFSTISSTISRDNTAGECARQAKLFAEFG
jgi:hypothetical protein